MSFFVSSILPKNKLENLNFCPSLHKVLPLNALCKSMNTNGTKHFPRDSKSSNLQISTVWRRKPRNIRWPVIKQINSFGFALYYLRTESFNWPICLWVPTPLHNTSYNTQLSIFTAWMVNAVRINSQRIKW